MYLGVRTLACLSGQSGWETPRMETKISLIEAHGLIVQPSHGAAGNLTIVLLNSCGLVAHRRLHGNLCTSERFAIILEGKEIRHAYGPVSG